MTHTALQHKDQSAGIAVSGKGASSEDILTYALKLPCGAVLPNRFAKAAMTEGLASPDNHATKRHVNLYDFWSRGGAGLLITGNVQVDRAHLERPGNVAIDGRQKDEAIQALKNYAKAGTKNGAHLWMQISHAGRQTPKSVNPQPKAPSGIKLRMPGAVFGEPKALVHDEILAIIQRFAFAAKTARETGFTGVQIHAAHGYLISEFLSPHVNRRNDEWGGSLQNRARLLLEIVRAVRKITARDFPISVKLNSADFQKSGFQHQEAIQVAKWLQSEGIDLLEISGGNYEAPAMMRLENLKKWRPKDNERIQPSTIAREAYFMKYAVNIREAVSMPLMVTGGFRSRQGLEEAIKSAVVDVAGLARPFCVDPYAARNLMNGVYQTAVPQYENTLRLGPTPILGANSPIRLVRAINGWGKQGWFCLQLLRMGDGKLPDAKMGILAALRDYQKNEAQAAENLRRTS